MGGMFENIRILDFTNNVAGPSCTALFADEGAEVIKIERPGVGDDVRSFAPRIEGQSVSMPWLNRGKKSVEIALDDPRGAELVRRMLADADVVVESFRPGVMKKLGFDYAAAAALRPDIVYCSISAFGQSGNLAGKPGYDLIAQACSGIMDLTGERGGPPEKHGSILGDYLGGINAFGAISAALYHRARTGEGQYIDVSLLDGLVYLNSMVDFSNVGLWPTRNGNHSPSLCPYGVFNGQNGQSVVICAPNAKLWTALCRVMGREDAVEDERFATADARMKNLPAVIRLIEGWLADFERIEDAVAQIDAAGIPCCKVLNTREMMSLPQLVSRGMIAELPAPNSLQAAGIPTLTARGPHIRYAKTPAVEGQPPDLGQHNGELLERYGLSAEDAALLEREWKQKALAKR